MDTGAPTIQSTFVCRRRDNKTALFRKYACVDCENVRRFEIVGFVYKQAAYVLSFPCPSPRISSTLSALQYPTKSKMFFTTTTLLSLLAASATLVSGASLTNTAKRQDGDNGSCAELLRICSGQVQHDLQNIWAVESCLLAGVCSERGGNNLDGFLGGLYVSLGNQGRPPLSAYLPRVPQSVSAFTLFHCSRMVLCEI